MPANQPIFPRDQWPGTLLRLGLSQMTRSATATPLRGAGRRGRSRRQSVGPVCPAVRGLVRRLRAVVHRARGTAHREGMPAWSSRSSATSSSASTTTSPTTPSPSPPKTPNQPAKQSQGRRPLRPGMASSRPPGSCPSRGPEPSVPVSAVLDFNRLFPSRASTSTGAHAAATASAAALPRMSEMRATRLRPGSGRRRGSRRARRAHRSRRRSARGRSGRHGRRCGTHRSHRRDRRLEVARREAARRTAARRRRGRARAGRGRR